MLLCTGVRAWRLKGYEKELGVFFICFRFWGFVFWIVGGERREGERKERTYVSWTDDGTVPVRHEDIVAVLEAIGARSVSDALLTLLESL